MKMLGLIGGMSWESTALYYQRINTRVRDKKGGLHSAPLVLWSVDFAVVAELQQAGQWHEAGKMLATAAIALKDAGAQALVICTNTMHKVAEMVEAGSGLPLIHIAECTGQVIAAQGIERVGLLGTQFTMEQDFYRGRLEQRGLSVLVPEADERLFVHEVIYRELCQGVVTDASRRGFERVIAGLKARGAQAVILGCTEICLLLPEAMVEGLPMFDTTAIHAHAAADFALGDV